MFALNGVAKISIYDANGKFVKDITHMNAVHIYNGNEEYPNIIAIESEVIDEEFESLYHNGIDERTDFQKMTSSDDTCFVLSSAVSQRGMKIIITAIGKDNKDNEKTMLYICDYCMFGLEKEPFGDVSLDCRNITTYTHYISCKMPIRCIIKK